MYYILIESFINVFLIIFGIENNMKILITMIIFTFCIEIFAQSSAEIKSLLMNGNNIQTEVWNYGSISSPYTIPQVKDFVWNGLGYLYEFGTLISAEVVDKDSAKLHITSDSFLSPNEGDYDASRMLKWGWLPIEGYANSSSGEIANNKNPETWADSWTEWPGEYGWGISVANQELYYKMNDYTNYEFIDRYQPFGEDVSKAGLGVSSKVRVYQFGGGLRDAVIVKYFLTNESDKDLDKVYFGFQGDPHIGGSADYGDDIARIVNTSYNSNTVKSEIANKTIYVFDNGMRGYGGSIPGYLSFKILESPDNLGLTSFHAIQWGSVNVKEDEKMWEFFSTGIDTINYLYNTSGDNVVNFGTGPFSLRKGETKIIKVALFLSKDYNDVLEDATYISLHHNWDLIGSGIGESGGNANYNLELNDFPSLIKGENIISWTYLGNSEAKVFLEYSNNNGIDWFPLAVDLNPDESFNWNTNNIDDGMNYILRAVAYSESNPKDYFYDISSSRFTIDNPSFNAKPELKLITALSDTTILESPINIEWEAEDADNSTLQIKIEYKYGYNEAFNEFTSSVYPNGKNSIALDIADYPNAEEYIIKVTASDGEKDSSLYSAPFKVNIFESTLTDAHIKSYRGNATPIIQIQTIDENLLTTDEYSLTFNVNEYEKTFNIKNITKNKILISDYLVSPLLSTPLIDGMKITIEDRWNDIDYAKSKFVGSNSSSLDFQVQFPANLGSPKIKVDEDYLFIFNDPDTLEDGNWLFADTLDTAIGSVFAPFSIWTFNGSSPDFEFLEPASFVLFEPNLKTQNNGRWDLGESIILRPTGVTDATTSYQITLDMKNNVFPRSGDSLYIITYNQIEDNDEFRFSADSNFVVKVKNEIKRNEYSLSNNYPNPFNPTTVIQYTLPKQSDVSVKIFDVLGREVTTLVNKVQPKGNYEIEFRASKLTSGIYFYRLQADYFIETKKMILLK